MRTTFEEQRHFVSDIVSNKYSKISKFCEDVSKDPLQHFS